MESSPAVAVTGLSKSYRIAHHADAPVTATEALLARLRHPLTRMERETFDALHDVTFEIPWGSVVGLIGRNGAGKSTLLKILTRITAPSAGRIVMGGRVGSLLEIGTGFHPELTGRENVYLNGTLLGMRRTEIRRRFDEIVAFAGVERFLDTQVKRYSTGMYVRLAFAVAAHLESEVMAVDEVLAVGDADFQAKCLEKLREVAQGGRTVILVSHQAQTIVDLCDSALYLERGRLRFQGPVDGALEEYRNSYRRIREAGLDASSRPGSGELRFTSVRSRRDLYSANEEKVIELEVSANPELAGRYWLVAHVLDDLGAVVAQCDSRVLGFWLEPDRPASCQLHLRTPWLKPGSYTVDAFAVRASDRIDVWQAATHFDVLPDPPYPVATATEATDRGMVFADFTFERC